MNGLTLLQKTMSSVEIAELTGKRHDHVMTDIRKMLDELGIQSPDFSGEQTFANNRKRKVYNLPKRECIILVSGYNIKMRAAIVDRWQELESNQPQIPQNLPEALRLAAELAEDKLKLEGQVQAMTPKVEALDRIATADGSLCIRDAAKTLQLRPKDLTCYLNEKHWIYKRVGVAYWIGYQHRIQQGWLEHKSTTVHKDDGTEKVVSQVRVTPKGLAKLSKAFNTQVA